MSVEVITDVSTLLKEYPLLHAVARASLAVKRHYPAVVKIQYKGQNVTDKLYMIGKGITYDTGGRIGNQNRRGCKDKWCNAWNVS